MGKTDKKEKKDKKERRDKKSKKERKEKKSSKRYESSSSSSSSESEGEQHRRVDKLATKVAAHLQRTGASTGGPTFVWTKKIERELESGKTVRDIANAQSRISQAERMEEIEKVRKRQAEREEEKARREEELSLIQRLRAAQEAMESEAKEEEFYLNALKNKAEKRFAEGRPSSIDKIAKNLHESLHGVYGCDMTEPWSYFEGLLLDEATELHQGICDYQEYDKYDDLHQKFWAALRVVADAELEEAKKRDAADRAALRQGQGGAGGSGRGGGGGSGRGGGGGAAASAAAAAEEEAAGRSSLHSDVEVQIENMLSGQTYPALVAMEGDVERALSGGLGDPEYWEAVLKRLQVHKAKAQVRELLAAFMQRHISAEIIKREQAREERKRQAEERRQQALAEGRDPAELDLEESSSEEEEEEEPERPEKPERGGAAGAAGGAAGEERRRKEPGTGPATEEEAAAAGPSRPAGADQMDTDGGAGTSKGEGADGDAGGEGEGGDAAAGGEEEASEEEDEFFEPDVDADGRHSPPPVRPAEVAGKDVVNEEDDFRALQLLRQQVKLQAANAFKAAAALASVPGANNQSAAERAYQALLARGGGATHPMLRNLAAEEEAAAAGGTGFAAFRGGQFKSQEEEDAAALALFRTQAEKTMGADEGDRQFGGEVSLDSKVYWWHEKYRPRKPKYFNRVHTGYEWNKYNQTHYDSDNPPPKVVQGYKFNIMYFDLIDKSKAPTYRLAPDPASPDGSTCLIIFSAGPPYEDIAFRIVNKEWEYSHKRGFKCTYDRGILHVYFNFQRTRYRR
ncbi:hypothetical protein CHLRE_09g398650v5 [Chlamydomonas reinhardtii]|uniref:Splicing factor Cactin n=1 Tax=Chlamydomonas reinhardtii TaxID=3055 RepID=A0A2K3DD08_CHLRE|nr:uncharacterized protein CHLRE_09g398650v5 [Chlamydomonas reinhardtii]PNW78408.1 hypothetical protein CHLRE_09g398650v5 [Chlamydomonas reinhardtii]